MEIKNHIITIKKKRYGHANKSMHLLCNRMLNIIWYYYLRRAIVSHAIKEFDVTATSPSLLVLIVDLLNIHSMHFIN